MKITLITPTRNRREAFEFLKTYIACQTIQPDQWIVCNDGEQPYEYTSGQTVIVSEPAPRGAASLCANLRAGLGASEGNAVLIIEDDDYYAPNYIETMIAALQRAPLVGVVPSIYYNVQSRCYRNMKNTTHASLANTGFRREVFDLVDQIARRVDHRIDMNLWREFSGDTIRISNNRLQIGLKGLPGETGIGVGHRLSDCTSDDNLKYLRYLIGDHARSYSQFGRAEKYNRSNPTACVPCQKQRGK